MDKLMIKKLLEDTLFAEGKFVFLPEFYEDFEELSHNTGNAKKVINRLLFELNAIIQLNNCDCGPTWLEHLKEYGNMYSLHIDTQFENYRILFSKDSYNKIFLHMFFEKAGKGKTSYGSHVPIAKERMKNYLKGKDKNEYCE